MPRKDMYHQTVITALIDDGWRITDDPLTLVYGGRNLFVDLGAERTIGAEKDGRKIAVEIKGFIGASDLHDLEEAVGQYNIYRDILAETKPERQLYLAVPLTVYNELFQEPLGLLITTRQKLQLLIFDETEARISQWIP